MKKLVIVSGYFNPLHKGHLDLFRKAKEVGDLLCVIVNNDTQRELKGSKFFQDQEERIEIIRELSIVDMAWISIDQDRTQNETLKMLVNSTEISVTTEVSTSCCRIAFLSMLWYFFFTKYGIPFMRGSF